MTNCQFSMLNSQLAHVAFYPPSSSLRAFLRYACAFGLRPSDFGSLSKSIPAGDSFHPQSSILYPRSGLSCAMRAPSSFGFRPSDFSLSPPTRAAVSASCARFALVLLAFCTRLVTMGFRWSLDGVTTGLRWDLAFLTLPPAPPAPVQAPSDTQHPPRNILPPRPPPPAPAPPPSPLHTSSPRPSLAGHE